MLFHALNLLKCWINPLLESYGHLEKELLQTHTVLAGVDEVGRGALAGPVYAGAAILDFSKLFQLEPSARKLVRDSKKLSPTQRQNSLSILEDICISKATASTSHEEIEALGISKATFLAINRALEKLSTPFDLLLIDGKYPLPDFYGRQKTVIGGDASCFSIAAASIIAKVARDTLMKEASLHYPQYGFEKHVGYATKQHITAIKESGACPIHRKNFEPIKSLCAVQ